MRAHTDTFIIRLDKNAQNNQRKYLSLKKIAFLGVCTAEDENNVEKSLFTKSGVLVNTVEEGSPADIAGFRPGDLLLSINNTEIKNFDHLLDIVRDIPPGSTVDVRYLSYLLISSGFNEENIQTKEVQLGEKELKLMRSVVTEMEYNLQYGEIVCIGANAGKVLPAAEIGDILLFHHLVEYKPRSTGDRAYNDYHLIEVLDNGDELRFVKIEHEVFGVLKPDQEEENMIIPHPQWIFCHPYIQKSSFQFKNGIWVPEGWELTRDQMAAKLIAIKDEMAVYETSQIIKGGVDELNYKQREKIVDRIEELNRERADLSIKMNQKKLVEAPVMFYNPDTTSLLRGGSVQRGDKLLCDLYSLYPLQIGKLFYSLAKVGAIEGVIN